MPSAANGRYLTDGSGRAIFLAGSHTWDNRQDLGTGAFDWSGYLSDLTTWGHNFVRLWLWEEPSPPNGYPNLVETTTTLTPEVWARSATPGANDGGNKFDLTAYNSTHFARLRQRCIDLGQRGIYVMVMLFNAWSIAQRVGGADPWPNHPFNAANNVNSIDGDTNDDGSGFEIEDGSLAAATALQEAYVEHVIDTVNDLDNVLFEICNESADDANTRGWQEAMIAHVQDYEATKPKQHPVVYSIMYSAASNNPLLASDAEAISPNADLAANDGTKVVIRDTDHEFGIGGTADWAWQQFAEGSGGILYMDSWDNLFLDGSGSGHPIQSLRANLGYIVTLAGLADILHTVPQGGGTDPCSTGYCLKPGSASYHEYVCYQPGNANFTLDLTAESGTFDIRKVNLADGTVNTAQTTTGGASRTITQPDGWTSGWAAWVRPQ